MSDTPATLTARAIAIGHELVSVCDSLGQSVAGNHIMMGLDILAAHHDLLIETERSSPGSGNSLGGPGHSLVGEPDERAPRIGMVGHPFEQVHLDQS